VPWQLFAAALTASGDSLVHNQHLITKVYFPRLAAPIAPILAALVDFSLAFAVLLGMMLCFGITPGWGILALPLFVLLAIATALSVSLWLSALNAIYRDVRHTLPFMAQTWMFATPVVYTTASVLADRPGWVRFVYGLNPMAGVVEGFRWALLDATSPSWEALASSVAVVALLLVGGAYYFRRAERTFADLV
jgi:lipopolysaccharide transport system permease protein